MDLTIFPPLNAVLNGLSTIFLILGFVFIRKGDKARHRVCMLSALATSTVFLACYLTYHAQAGRTVFRDPAWFRPIYLTILLTHTVLAVVTVPLVLATVYNAIKERFETHRRLARWTWPIWLYVSITGVVIYLLLYRIFPQAAGR